MSLTRRVSLIVLLLLLASPALAKDKAPKEYQQGKLLNIEEKDTVQTTYVSQKQSDGRTVTTPVEDKQKHYFITVQLADMVYVGEYTPAFFGKPGDWVIGDPISVRLDGNNMYLQKPNGKELKSKIRKRIRAAEAPAAAANP
ncbi:MAG TPA: hypothetical protein VJR29_05140 [bacterium]|nr:hypothetical protein [bacterium]